MYKVKGTLTNGKGFKFDARAATLADAVTELTQKLAGQKIEAGITRVSFATRSPLSADLELVDVVKRERKPAAKGGKK